MPTETEGWTLWAYQRGQRKTVMLLDWVYRRGYTKRKAVKRGRMILRARRLKNWVLEVRPFNHY